MPTEVHPENLLKQASTALHPWLLGRCSEWSRSTVKDRARNEEADRTWYLPGLSPRLVLVCPTHKVQSAEQRLLSATLTHAGYVWQQYFPSVSALSDVKNYRMRLCLPISKLHISPLPKRTTISHHSFNGCSDISGQQWYIMNIFSFLKAFCSTCYKKL